MNVSIYSRGHIHIEIDPEMQVKACLEYAEKNGHSIVAAYGDLTEEECADFPAFSWMMKKCKRSRFEAILVYSPRCFAETEDDFLTKREQLYRKGIKVIFVENSPSFPGNENIEQKWCSFRAFCKGYLSYNIRRGIYLARQCKAAENDLQTTDENNLKKVG